MKVRISELPEGVTERDIRELLEDSKDIEDIEIFGEDEDGEIVAVISMSSDAAGEGAVEMLNGRRWKDAILRADKLLY